MARTGWPPTAGASGGEETRPMSRAPIRRSRPCGAVPVEAPDGVTVDKRWPGPSGPLCFGPPTLGSCEMTTDWRTRLREKIAANPLASSGPPLEVTGVVEPLDDSAIRRAGAMELKYNSAKFLGLSPRHLQLLNFEAAPSGGGRVELSLRFRYFRSGSIGEGSRPVDETSEVDFNDLP